MGFSGWQGVLNYISGMDEKNLFVEALKEDCEYVIVQIDTDRCADYGVEHQTDDLTVLWKNVYENLVNRIPADFDKSKLIFAISIDETECWLIPFIDTNKKNCENIDRCVNLVNKGIKKQKKPKEIKECSDFNYGFKKLIEQLDEISAKES